MLGRECIRCLLLSPCERDGCSIAGRIARLLICRSLDLEKLKVNSKVRAGTWGSGLGRQL